MTVLRTASEKATDEQAKRNLDRALVQLCLRQDKYAEALKPAERLFRAYPESSTAFKSYYFILAQTGRYDEAETLVNDRLQKDSHDLDAFELISDSAERRGDFKRALSLIAPVLQQPKPRASLLNNYAWDGGTLHQPHSSGRGRSCTTGK